MVVLIVVIVWCALAVILCLGLGLVISVGSSRTAPPVRPITSPASKKLSLVHG